MKLFRAFAAALLAVACANLALAQDLIEYIEVHRVLAPGEMIDFVFVDDLNVVTRQSIGDPDSLGFVTVQVPSNAARKSVHAPSCYFFTLENSIVSGLTPGFDQSADIPLLVNDISGLTVVPVFLVDFLSLVPDRQIGNTFAVSGGASSEYSFGTIYAPPLAFPALTDSDFINFDSYPTFTGTARVAEVLSVRVYVVPEPTSLSLAAASGMILLAFARLRTSRSK